MKNKSYLYLGLALILVVLVIAIFVFGSAPDAEEADPEAAAALPTTAGEAERPTVMPVLPEDKPAAEPPAEAPEEAPAAVPEAAEPEPVAESAVGAPEREDYVSVTDFFKVKVPAGWSAEEALPGAAFTMANSAAALERYEQGTAVAAGDRVVNIGFLPYALLRQKELSSLDIQLGAPADVLLASLMPLFRVGEDVQMGGPELVALPDGRSAGRLTVAEDGREGLILLFGAGEEVLAVVSAVSRPGEMAELQEVTNALAAEITFSGAQDELYGILLGG